MSKFYKLSDETIQTFLDIYNTKAIPINLGIQYVGSETQKHLIRISKMPDQFNFILTKDILVSINEELLDTFDSESISILIEQEIDKISISIDTGKIKMVRPDLTTFSGLINKHGIKKICKANKIEQLFAEQKEDEVRV